MLTARRLHEHRAQEAAGQATAPAPRAPAEIPYSQHQSEMVALETRLRAELGGGPFVLDVDSAEFQAAIKPLLDDFEARAIALVASVEELEAWKAALLPEDHKRPTLEEFVASGYKAELYDERMAAWEHELVHAASGKRIEELQDQAAKLTADLEATRLELLKWQAAADVPAAKTELAAGSPPVPEAAGASATPPAPEQATPAATPAKGGKPKAR